MRWVVVVVVKGQLVGDVPLKEAWVVQKDVQILEARQEA